MAKISRREAYEYCSGCMKFNAALGTCIAFTELYPLWEHVDIRSGDKCFARVENPKEYLSVLLEMLKNAREKAADPSHWLKAEIARVQRIIKLLESRKEDPSKPYISSEEIREVFEESQRIPILKRRSEKSDRTHKLFPRERMRDNRYIEPWSGFL